MSVKVWRCTLFDACWCLTYMALSVALLLLVVSYEHVLWLFPWEWLFRGKDAGMFLVLVYWVAKRKQIVLSTCVAVIVFALVVSNEKVIISKGFSWRESRIVSQMRLGEVFNYSQSVNEAIGQDVGMSPVRLDDVAVREVNELSGLRNLKFIGVYSGKGYCVLQATGGVRLFSGYIVTVESFIIPETEGEVWLLDDRDGLKVYSFAVYHSSQILGHLN